MADQDSLILPEVNLFHETPGSFLVSFQATNASKHHHTKLLRRVLLAAAIPYNLLMSEYSFLKAQLHSWFKTP